MLGKIKAIGTQVQTGLESAATQGNKMIANARGVAQSTDENFELQRKEFDTYALNMDQLLENIRRQLSGIKSLTDGLGGYSQGIAYFSGEERRITLSNEFVQQCETTKASGENFKLALAQMEINLKRRSEVLGLLRRDMNERDRLLLEFDKVRHDLATEQKKPTPNPATISTIQGKITAAQQNYEKRNDEVLRQLNETYQARDIQFEFYEFLGALSAFFTSGAGFVELSKKSNQLPVTSQAPPPLPNKEGAQKRAKALYPFNGQAPTELSLQPGDIIIISNNSHPDWWQGSANGRSGTFPSNYVQLLP